jgi:hypothetical protein
LADRRLGATAEDRLRWLVNEFLATDLKSLLGPERVALGYLLRQLTPPVGVLTYQRLGPLRDEDLWAVQKRIRRGLEALVKGPDWPASLTDATAGFSLPRTRHDRLVRMTRMGDKPAIFQLVTEAESEVHSIIRAAGDLILRGGRRLRACALAECQRPFVARRKAQFCSETHAQKFRNLKRLGQRAGSEAID